MDFHGFFSVNFARLSCHVGYSRGGIRKNYAAFLHYGFAPEGLDIGKTTKKNDSGRILNLTKVRININC
jgi:hypothetical protein